MHLLFCAEKKMIIKPHPKSAIDYVRKKTSSESFQIFIRFLSRSFLRLFVSYDRNIPGSVLINYDLSQFVRGLYVISRPRRSIRTLYLILSDLMFESKCIRPN